MTKGNNTDELTWFEYEAAHTAPAVSSLLLRTPYGATIRKNASPNHKTNLLERIPYEKVLSSLPDSLSSDADSGRL